MEEFNIQGKQTSFCKYCPGTFGYTLVYVNLPMKGITQTARFWLNICNNNNKELNEQTLQC